MTRTLPADPRPYLDTSGIDWSAVTHATYEVRQTYSYEYPGVIEDLHQVLVVVPPDAVGGQRFEVRMHLEQRAGVAIAAPAGADATYLLPSPLAEPFAALRPVADALRRKAP